MAREARGESIAPHPGAICGRGAARRFFVRHWRRRWLSGQAEVAAAVRLADEPRPGAPATFTPEQVCAIVALACEPPEKSELPLSHWSQSELAREAVRRGIVDSIRTAR